MREKVFITCAVTGGGDTVGKHPAIPVTPEQIATAAIEAGEAGAAIAHIHVRDPKTGKPSRDIRLYREVVERIRASNSRIVINLTCGAGGRYVPDQADPCRGAPGSTVAPPLDRVAHVVELKPEICSLDCATMNMGEFVFMNTPAHLRQMAKAIRDAGTKPELEVFDVGHLQLARRLVEDGLIAPPALFQIVLGVAWGAPATPQAMAYMSTLVPPGAHWASFGISRMQFPMVAQTVLLGGHVRVGLEDNLYIERGVLAKNNAALVEKAVKIVRLMGVEVASPAEVRAELGLRGTP
ncbi:MAG: 3-keto-5-aminohexanoate cleavage protein [Alphaproteobacteria bacterium]|nr:3-keto-5-aminohexanoate cleavage protein [Alphaproteobacteria bacterium]